MSNPDPHPTDTVCLGDPAVDGLLSPREVPLGGPRAMTVRRTLPHREISLIGAWCFCDHYGPDDVAETGGMHVARHPHTGLATVSWLFSGGVDHLDSTGGRARIEPGDLALMAAGRGITHQEISTPETEVLHGVQLWYALPDATRHGDPGLQEYTAPPVELEGGEARVFIGSLLGSTSPVETWTEGLVGAEIRLGAGAEVTVPVDPAFEHGLLMDSGELAVRAAGASEGGADEHVVPDGHLLHLAVGREELVLRAGPEGARLVLIGGVPLGEEIVMFWNFVGRSHEEVASFRARYQRELGFEPGEPTDTPVPLVADEVDLFGPWPEGQPEPLPAPNLPNARLRPRG
ncbi:hypothetical protein SAMN05445756_1092 [Kytococcus aerolatus]|uniref:Pirin n=1 Tax=Kytococcus aerolatus TaxID=592308 RepID=A0A212TET5_9MICO|nr:pirin family protein [Kytococcus aerolatus]SNC64341.1 hypothetical protein SAMN05445756_1092 [Kytococcus aerolatus]